MNNDSSFVKLLQVWSIFDGVPIGDMITIDTQDLKRRRLYKALRNYCSEQCFPVYEYGGKTRVIVQHYLDFEQDHFGA